MRLLDKYLLSSVATMIPRMAESEGDPPPADVPADPVAQMADPPAADLPADPAPAAPPATRADTPRWALERIGEETGRRQTAEQRAAEAERRAADLQAMIERLQQPPAAGDPPKAAAPPAPARPAVDQDAVRQEAARLRFAEKLTDVSNAGANQYGQKWADAVAALNAYGANSEEFVASVIDIDAAKAHEIMFNIAQDGERAVALARMSPTKRAAEITRMIMAEAKNADPKALDPKPADPKAAAEPAKAAPQISRAPAPKPVLQPQAPAKELDPTNPDDNEKMSDSEFERWYKGKYYKGAA